MPDSDRPIGIFDSGIGGLSVLRHILQQLPQENLIYFADSGHAPYGDKPLAQVVERSLAVANHLIGSGCKALVVACNTATAAAIVLLREQYPHIPIVGVEPGLKPATVLTKSGTVGVLATERTLASKKFSLLRDQLAADTGVRFAVQACNGLADRIERDELDTPDTQALLQRCVAPLVAQQADTLVLGCTHYPFVQAQIQAAARQAGAHAVQIVDTGEPVARQLARLLAQRQLENRSDITGSTGTLTALTTGEAAHLADAFNTLLHIKPPVTTINV